jgi:hypothetical protein
VFDSYSVVDTQLCKNVLLVIPDGLIGDAQRFCDMFFLHPIGHKLSHLQLARGQFPVGLDFAMILVIPYSFKRGIQQLVEFTNPTRPGPTILRGACLGATTATQLSRRRCLCDAFTAHRIWFLWTVLCVTRQTPATARAVVIMGFRWSGV